jgi:hypothetical protein
LRGQETKHSASRSARNLKIVVALLAYKRLASLRALLTKISELRLPVGRVVALLAFRPVLYCGGE